jgi:Fe-S-cluster-containing hydrogenase component 2
MVCPNKAINRNVETGAMEVDESLCIGCGVCALSCPFGLIVMGISEKAIKCNLCGGDPECVKACTYGALEFASEDTGALEKRSIVFKHLERAFESLNPPPKPFSFPELKHS